MEQLKSPFAVMIFGEFLLTAPLSWGDFLFPLEAKVFLLKFIIVVRSLTLS